MNGKKAKELRSAALMLAPDDPGRDYRGQLRINWRSGARTYQVHVGGQRGVYRRLKHWYKAASRKDATVMRIADRVGLRVQSA